MAAGHLKKNTKYNVLKTYQISGSSSVAGLQFLFRLLDFESQNLKFLAREKGIECTGVRDLAAVTAILLSFVWRFHEFEQYRQICPPFSFSAVGALDKHSWT